MKRETNKAGPAMPAATPETTKMPAPMTAPKPIVMPSPSPSCRFSRLKGEEGYFLNPFLNHNAYELEQITPINM